MLVGGLPFIYLSVHEVCWFSAELSILPKVSSVLNYFKKSTSQSRLQLHIVPALSDEIFRISV